MNNLEIVKCILTVWHVEIESIVNELDEADIDINSLNREQLVLFIVEVYLLYTSEEKHHTNIEILRQCLTSNVNSINISNTIIRINVDYLASLNEEEKERFLK